MDERKLTELLRDAVADAPPPTFDRDDVTKESTRLTRRRNSIVTRSAVGVAVLASASALTVALWTASDSTDQTSGAASAVATGNGNAAPNELPEEDQAAPRNEGGGASDSSPESRKQGRASDEEAGSLGPGSTPSGCEQADRELAAALAGELPAAAPPLPERFDCLDGVTGVSFQVDGGMLTAMLVPSSNGTGTMGSQPGMRVEQASAPTGNGDTVVIMSVSPIGSPPYTERLDEWARRVAEEY